MPASLLYAVSSTYIQQTYTISQPNPFPSPKQVFHSAEKSMKGDTI